MTFAPTRREALALLLAAPAASAAADPHYPGLVDLAERAGLLFGASVAREVLEDEAYAALYRRETGLLVSDWALKFPVLRPDDGPARYEGADALVGFARANNLPFRGHALVWNEDKVDWLRRRSAREIERVFDRHIDETAGRYAGRFHSWDVVNEPFWPGHGASGGYRRGPWFDALGAPYVERAFRRARAADRGVRLVLNEAHAERADALGLAIRKNLLALIDRLRDADVPLDAVGLQGHLQPQHPFDDQGFARFLEEIAARRLDIYITELDVDDGGLPGGERERDKAVARRYEGFLRAVLRVPAVKVVCTWQLADRYSWYRDPELMRSLGRTAPARPLPFDDGLRRKPAWHAIARAFRERR